jgi:hypothetical protein
MYAPIGAYIWINRSQDYDLRGGKWWHLHYFGGSKGAAVGSRGAPIPGLSMVTGQNYLLLSRQNDHCAHDGHRACSPRQNTMKAIISRMILLWSLLL